MALLVSPSNLNFEFSLFLLWIPIPIPQFFIFIVLLKGRWVYIVTNSVVLFRLTGGFGYFSDGEKYEFLLFYPVLNHSQSWVYSRNLWIRLWNQSVSPSREAGTIYLLLRILRKYKYNRFIKKTKSLIHFGLGTQIQNLEFV